MQLTARIGETVKYVRHNNKTGLIERGEGVVKAYGLDPENRIVVLVRDNNNVEPATGKFVQFNTPARAINPTPEFEMEFEKLVLDVKTIEKHAKQDQQHIVDEANTKITGFHNDVLGEPLDIADCPPPPAPIPTSAD